MRCRFKPALSATAFAVLWIAYVADCPAQVAVPPPAASASSARSPAGPEQLPDALEARLQACTGCHGQQGRGVENVYFPRLAGKPAGYLYNQLVAFRNGSRKYPPMNYLLAYLPDPYLQKMADYFSAQDMPVPVSAHPVVPAEVLAAGETIVHAGVPAKRIPACIACHGARLGGREPGIPGLLGLRADYISAQLGAWRYGTRTASAPDCMQYIASSLTEAQAAAVSAYLALQAAPSTKTDRQAIGSGSKPLPLACGSQK